MITTTTDIAGLLVIEPKVFADQRGHFFESYNARAFSEATGLSVEFVQDNHSHSTRGVLRGLHYQLPPKAQGKLVRVVDGAVYDVAVDLRKNSATFGRWTGHRLSAENRKQLWIPPGLAHGFLVLSDTAEVLYKTTDYYSPEHERSLHWRDPAIGIDWPLDGMPIVAAKDAAAPPLAAAEIFAGV